MIMTYRINKVEKLKIWQKDRLAKWSKARKGERERDGCGKGEIVGSNPGGRVKKRRENIFFPIFLFRLIYSSKNVFKWLVLIVEA